MNITKNVGKLIAAVGFVLGLLTPAGAALADTSVVVPPNSNAYGNKFSE